MNESLTASIIILLNNLSIYLKTLITNTLHLLLLTQTIYYPFDNEKVRRFLNTAITFWLFLA